MEAWSDFFVASAGAAAALGGLMIVAISVNVGEIIKYSALPIRAGAAIASLVLVLVTSVLGLAPQPVPALGVEVLVVALVVWGLQIASGRTAYLTIREQRRPLREAAGVIGIGQALSLPVIIAAVLLIMGVEAGPYVLLGGLVLIFCLAVLEAWVLLIEILR